VREEPVPGAVRGSPYFMISYSHTERYDQGDDRKPDVWVSGFYKDLCHCVEELAAVPSRTPAGVLDRELWVENDWLVALPEALASCRVLVPLYSNRYFQSEICGKEWYAFASRPASQRYPVPHTPAIIPVMWDPMPPNLIHQAARTVPIEYGDLDSYARLGLYGIMKQSSHSADYYKLVREVARRIVAKATSSPAGPWPVVGLGSLPNSFVPDATPRSGAPRLLITVVAPDRGDLPPGRDGQYYGAAAWDWAPYLPASDRTIADCAAKFARRLGYPPYIFDLREREQDLLAEETAAHPELLIIDPWAVMRPECQLRLARLRLENKPWVLVVIPWNPADGETAAAADRLRRALDSALGHKLERGRVTSAIAVEGVPSVDAFDAVLPLLIPVAGSGYLRHAPAFPPAGPVVEKPTLQGLTPEPPNSLERTGA